MDTRLVVLKLILGELKVPASIKTLNDRKRVQKAIYLGQCAGVELGYHFGWYLKGPYSPGLTKDYYSLAEALPGDDRDSRGKRLHPLVRRRLQGVLPLMSPPDGLELSVEDWLELVSSYHYLLTVTGLTRPKARELLATQKPHLVGHTDDAEQALKAAGIIN